MTRLYSVAECDEHIARAQHVLDQPTEYEVEARVDADRSRRRWQVIRAHADRVAELEAALERALRLADWYAHRLGEHPKDCQWCQMAVEQQDALDGDGGGA